MLLASRYCCLYHNSHQWSQNGCFPSIHYSFLLPFLGGFSRHYHPSSCEQLHFGRITGDQSILSPSVLCQDSSENCLPYQEAKAGFRRQLHTYSQTLQVHSAKFFEILETSFIRTSSVMLGKWLQKYINTFNKFFQLLIPYTRYYNPLHSLHIFYSIFHCGLYCRAANITDNLCTKQGNSSIKSAVYKQERFQIKSGL